MHLFLIATVSGAIIATTYYLMSARSRKIKRWRKALSINKHQRMFEQLYHEVNGFALSHTARLHSNAMEYIYGEINFESFAALLSLCKPNKDTVFYDLGSGTGKAVLTCAMLFNVQKSCGIEWFASLHEAACKQQKKLLGMADYSQKAGSICLVQGDFLKHSFMDATLVFINATTFFTAVWQRISQHLAELPAKTVIISTSKALDSPLFVTKHVTPVTMSWGVVNAYIQERLE